MGVSSFKPAGRFAFCFPRFLFFIFFSWGKEKGNETSCCPAKRGMIGEGLWGSFPKTHSRLSTGKVVPRSDFERDEFK